jgi:hypothetical protein
MFGSAFSGLREHTLRRLYKFVLKRVLGPYLESELLLEVCFFVSFFFTFLTKRRQQLEVDSGLGLVSIRNLRLDSNVLNQYLKDSPFQLIEAEISELQASISYNTLLADGCNLTCRGIKFVITPQTPSPQGDRSTSISGERGSDPEMMSSSLRDIGELQEKLADDSIGFIAQWIEVIIARLKISVEDLHIIFLSNSTDQISTALHLTLSTLEFYNSHPRLTKDDGGSVMVASNLYTSLGSTGNSFTKSLVAAMSN